jgi:preprotein translocase subunit SecG
MRSLFNWISIIAASLMAITILLQQRGSSLGASFGGESNFYRTKRGAEKVIYQTTIISAIVFILSVILSILSKR